tara:strand:+ start:10526 stop:11215 length:690 start_codon:yes stop_codon:yes gene_type:complete
MEEETNFIYLITEDSETNRFLAVMLGIMMTSIAYHAVVFFHFKSDDIKLKNTIPDWNVAFNSSTYEYEETQIIADSQKSSFFLEVEEDSVGTNNFVGFLSIDISYGETSGNFGDPCDFVTANLRPEGVVAQWENETNILSGSSDSCDTISLFLQVYPDFDGTNKTESGKDEEQAIYPWTNSSFGFGEYNLEVEVNTQELVSGLPTQSDDNEEVTVLWSLVAFIPQAIIL